METYKVTTERFELTVYFNDVSRLDYKTKYLYDDEAYLEDVVYKIEDKNGNEVPKDKLTRLQFSDIVDGVERGFLNRTSIEPYTIG